MDHKIKCHDKDGEFITLADILLDENTPLDILAIGKFPAPTSVSIGHYYQGLQGKRFWSNLLEYGILNKVTRFEDDSCLINPVKIGLTDIVKRPRESGNEPTKEEYLSGLRRVCEIIETYSPKVILFVYKKALDNFILHRYPTNYGFNEHLEKLFEAKVFVCPIAGVGGVSAQEIHKHMTDLKNYCNKHILAERK